MLLPEFTIKKSKRRKTIAIKIQNQQVIVHSPYGVSVDYLTQLVEQKQQWIATHLQRQSELAQPEHFDRTTIDLFGQPYELNWQIANRSSETISENSITIYTARRVKDPESFRVKQLENLFSEQLNGYISQRIAHFSALMDLSYQQVQIKYYRRRWGSCSSKGVISFNLLLAQVPTWVIDYVIVHELAHLRFMDHSSNFWQLVKQYYFEIDNAQDWLNEKMMELDTR